VNFKILLIPLNSQRDNILLQLPNGEQEIWLRVIPKAGEYLQCVVCPPGEVFDTSSIESHLRRFQVRSVTHNLLGDHVVHLVVEQIHGRYVEQPKKDQEAMNLEPGPLSEDTPVPMALPRPITRPGQRRRRV